MFIWETYISLRDNEHVGPSVNLGSVDAKVAVITLNAPETAPVTDTEFAEMVNEFPTKSSPVTVTLTATVLEPPWNPPTPLKTTFPVGLM